MLSTWGLELFFTMEGNKMKAWDRMMGKSCNTESQNVKTGM
jgi:hypothetical protein